MIGADINFAKASLEKSAELRADLLNFHPGEKGRFNENQLAKVIRRFLPGKMEIGTGFIACSSPGFPRSPQQDIVVYDAIENVPLFHDELVDIFPIEAVYGTVEIKTTLTKAELRKSLMANRKIRDMAAGGKFYRLNVSREIANGQHIAEYITARADVPPRFFLFAYSSETDDLETLKANFIELSLETNAHCHGICVLDKDWFIARNAYDTPEVATVIDTNGFAVFISRLSLALNSMQILQADLERYEQAKIAAAGNAAKTG